MITIYPFDPSDEWRRFYRYWSCLPQHYATTDIDYCSDPGTERDTKPALQQRQWSPRVTPSSKTPSTVAMQIPTSTKHHGGEDQARKPQYEVSDQAAPATSYSSRCPRQRAIHHPPNRAYQFHHYRAALRTAASP